MHKLLFVLGPTEIEQDILDIGGQPLEYMRTSEYANKWNRIFNNLKYVFQTKNEVICYTSSGTGAMDAAVSNFCSKGQTALVINGGSFGARWVDICSFYGINVIEHKVPFGKSVNPEDIKDILNNNNIDVLYATLNETSSGVLTNIKAIGDILKAFPNVLFVVDCISGLITDEFLQDEWNVDVAISASQKAFAIPPGLSFLSYNSKAYERHLKAGLKSFYFNLSEYRKDFLRNQTPYTPAVSLVNQLDARLEKIKTNGLENIRASYKETTQKIRNILSKYGFEMVADNPTNCVTAYYSNHYDAFQIVSIMRDKYNIEIAPSGGDLKHKLFRVGNFGSVTDKEIKYFESSFEKTINELNS